MRIETWKKDYESTCNLALLNMTNLMKDTTRIYVTFMELTNILVSRNSTNNRIK